MKNISLSAISLAAILCASGAQATSYSNSNASFSNFHIELIDLDGSDNIAPTINFVFPDNHGAPWPPTNGSSVDANIRLERDGRPALWALPGKDNDAVASVAIAGAVLDQSSASATITAGTGLFAMQGASGTTQGAAVYSDRFSAGHSIYSANAYLFNNVQFTVSAHTQVVFSFDATSTASASENGRDSSGATSGVWLSLDSDAGGERISAGQLTYVRSSEIKTETGSHTLSFYNRNAGDLGGTARMYAYIQGGVSAQPVPEPETYAMLLAGLGLLGCAAKRRRS